MTLRRRLPILPGCLLAIGIGAYSLSVNAQSPAHDQKADHRNLTPSTDATLPPANTGGYYALVIGISTYEHEPHLLTPLNDANEIAAVLTNQYGFESVVLLDANRDQILRALEGYKRSLAEPDSLIVYFAGHGYYDKQEGVAYLAPVDAAQDSYSRWITAPDVTGPVRAMRARHVLVIADSCYSGMLTTKDALSPDSLDQTREQENTSYLNMMSKARSRNVLASGGDEPVLDGDAPGHFSNHSVFANVLLENLSKIQANEFSAQQLYLHIFGGVQARHAAQQPEYDRLLEDNVEHANGDFVFHRVNARPVTSGPEIVHSIETEKVPIPNTDEQAIRAVLDTYEDAYDSMDVHEIRKVWPSLSRAQEREISGGFRTPSLNAVRVQLRNRKMRVAGERATADCDQWMIYTFAGRRQPPQTNSVEIELARDQGGSWAIDGVKGK